MFRAYSLHWQWVGVILISLAAATTVRAAPSGIPADAKEKPGDRAGLKAFR
jgi:hypothetical protein